MSASDHTARRRHGIVEQLRRSQIYRDYEKAFRETTGLPLKLRAPGALDLPHRDDPRENPFCALMAGVNRTCAACLQLQHEVEAQAQLGPQTLQCFAGLCDSAVPVRVGDDLIAFLQTGQIFLHRPTPAEFTQRARQMLQWGAAVDLKQLEEAWFQTRVLDRKQYESILRLLHIFAQHLATLSTELMLKTEQTDAPAIQQARHYIDTRQHEELSLGEVARAVNMSSFYFCKTFKRATGMTFTDYLARVRIEKVKNLLLNPHKRISEAAFASGFQSLSQFNRVFRRVAGESPSDYRARVHPSPRAVA